MDEVDPDVAEDAAKSLLKACQFIRWRESAKPKTELIPTEEDAGTLIMAGCIMAACHLDHVLELFPCQPQALALRASLEIITGDRGTARTYFNRLLLANPMDIRSFTLLNVLQEQLDQEKPDCQKIIRAMKPLIKKIENGLE